MNIPIDTDLINTIHSTFRTDCPHVVKTKPVSISFNGFFIKTSSNKTVWRNIGFAKTALLNHFENNDEIREFICKRTGDYPYKDNLKELIRTLESMGVIKYVEVDIEDFACQRKN